MVGHVPLEVAKTVLEAADLAWTAAEYRRRLRYVHKASDDWDHAPLEEDEEELESLRSENRRLRNLLQQNIELLQDLSESPCLSPDCPADLYDQLVSTINSEKFLTQLKLLHESVDGTGSKFPFKEASGMDLQSAEELINIDLEEPSWWVWVTDDMVPSDVEELSGIDDEKYLVVSEEQVVDGVAYFMAICILSDRKALTLTPEELQKTLNKALKRMNKLEKMLNVWHAGKMFYTLSTWGLALVGLYNTRAILKFAAMGVHTTSKVVLKAL
ncbi:uncharacterized protein LOC127808488 [Diospyros lotus]|uniref:uncharacterized protein LOC127808488 n=1 Tax=Diospyros lotus TaxID=55363 RepID=UPI0022576E00|nr:uncharacterized protein LOC127808488 [Diospyros lotus]